MKVLVKEVEYFKQKLTVPNFVQWLAADINGVLYGYSEEPKTYSGIAFDARGKVFIAVVDFEKVTAAQSKVKV